MTILGFIGTVFCCLGTWLCCLKSCKTQDDDHPYPIIVGFSNDLTDSGESSDLLPKYNELPPKYNETEVDN
jgi:hypothetical protein